MLACAAATALLALAALVRLGVTRPLDDLVRQWARPDNVWGSLQVKADVVVEGLPPDIDAAPDGRHRRDDRPGSPPRPLLVGAATVLLTVAVTVGLKLLLHRPDPHECPERPRRKLSLGTHGDAGRVHRPA